MIRSMTGYARQEHRSELGTMVCELRSINHRYLEMVFRLPEELRAIEGALRAQAAAVLGRGKLECMLNYRPAPSATSRVDTNEELIGALIETAHRVEERMLNPARISVMEILAWPGVIQEPDRDPRPLQEAAGVLFEEALKDLVEARAREGGRLAELIKQRVDGVEALVARVRERRPQVLQAIREKLMSRIAGLEVEPDSARLEQELAFIAQKLDVDEELDRLQSHCQEARAILRRNEPVGRRLDFLMQEFNREANTLGSKAADIETTQAAVELKVLIEQMREQVQNIE